MGWMGAGFPTRASQRRSARGIELEKEELSGEKGLTRVLAMDVEELTRFELQVLVDQIRSLNHSIAELEKVIDREGKKLKGHGNLTSIKGIGSLGASILLSVIGDVRDFPDEGRLASYFGIVPRMHNSNETERSGHITKRGSKLGRTALVQCALIAQRYRRHALRDRALGHVDPPSSMTGDSLMTGAP